MPLWLTEEDVRAVLTMPALMETMEQALAAFSAGDVVQPVRTALEMRERTFFALMPAFDKVHDVLGAKLVSVVPENAARGLATHLASISLFDPATGELRAVMDGRLITEMRTAAVSAISVKYLARRGASRLAILGSGIQARSHVEAMRLVAEFTEIRAWSPTPQHLRTFGEEMGAPVRAAASANEAVSGADVVLLATNSVTPAIEDDWVGEGAHVIAIGACRPSQRELAPELVARGLLVVDSRDAARQESGDVVQGICEGRFPSEHAAIELGDIVAGRVPGRTGDRQVTVFKSLGLAIEDVAAAGMVWQKAVQSGRGMAVALQR